jgi:hypothetical protein
MFENDAGELAGLASNSLILAAFISSPVLGSADTDGTVYQILTVVMVC